MAMRRVLARLLTIHADTSEVLQRGRAVVVLAIAMASVALIFVPVALILQSRPQLSIAIEMFAMVIFISAALLARSGRVGTGAGLLLGILIAAPLLVLIGGRSINIIPFALLFSVVIASLLLRPSQIWLVLVTDLLGLVLALVYLCARGVILTEFDAAVVIVASVMLVMVALVSFLGAREIHAERAALRREIADRLLVEAALSQAKDAAEAANRAKSAFLANMSHELRTPLTSILGYTDLLLFQFEEQQDAQLLNDLTVIRRSGDHLLSLINDVLDLSRIEAGRLDMALETFQIAPVVQDLVAEFAAIVERNGNTLALELAGELGTMHADRMKIRQILGNLLSNAAKFTEQGSITLSVWRQAMTNVDWIYFRVTDTGIGIAAEQLSTLFQAFTRGHASTTRKYEGTGLGLALSSRLCALMGGTIAAESSLGVGSVFTVRLPAVVSET
jgi:signal transduction histidine kinase